jgi:hypothetical protein
MGRRGNSGFKRLDVIRALRSARDGGLEPAMMEVSVAADGAVTFRVFGDKAAAVSTSESADTKAWAAEIEKLKKGR